MANYPWIPLAQEQLDRLWTGTNNESDAKKQATVIAMAAAQIAGQSRETVYDLPDTCSRNTYHRWAKDPLFVEVQAAVAKLARNWHNERSLRALANATEMLALLTPESVATIAKVMSGSSSDRLRLQAALAVLDRAAIETSTKSLHGVDTTAKQRHNLDNIDLSALSDDELDRLHEIQSKLLADPDSGGE